MRVTFNTSHGGIGLGVSCCCEKLAAAVRAGERKRESGPRQWPAHLLQLAGASARPANRSGRDPPCSPCHIASNFFPPGSRAFFARLFRIYISRFGRRFGPAAKVMVIHANVNTRSRRSHPMERHSVFQGFQSSAWSALFGFLHSACARVRAAGLLSRHREGWISILLS